MQTLEIDIVYGKINLQCGTVVQWTKTFPETLPHQLQPYVGFSLEEAWNYFQSYQLDLLLENFNEDIQPTLSFHLCTCIFSILAFIGNVVVVILFRHQNWRELYPVTCMVVVFAVLLITQYRTVIIFRETLDILRKRLEKSLSKTLLKESKTQSGEREDQTHEDVERKGEKSIGILSFEVVLENIVVGKGTTRSLLYTARIGLGEPIYDAKAINKFGKTSKESALEII